MTVIHRAPEGLPEGRIWAVGTLLCTSVVANILRDHAWRKYHLLLPAKEVAEDARQESLHTRIKTVLGTPHVEVFSKIGDLARALGGTGKKRDAMDQARYWGCVRVPTADYNGHHPAVYACFGPLRILKVDRSTVVDLSWIHRNGDEVIAEYERNRRRRG